MSSNELQTIGEFLKSQSTLALATVDESGQPQTAPLFYVSDEEFNLYWLSSSGSRHSVNLMLHGQVAATIYPAVWQWAEIRGLQIEGTASAVTDESIRAEVVERYRQKFDLPTAFDKEIAASTLYMLKPRWLRWLDNGVSFRYKVEVQF